MSGRLLESDAVAKTRVDWLEEGGRVYLDHSQDVEDVVEANKVQYNASDGSMKGDLKHVARIPLVVWQDMVKQGIVAHGGGILDEKRFKAWLNDRNNRAFRTHPGRV